MLDVVNRAEGCSGLDVGGDVGAAPPGRGGAGGGRSQRRNARRRVVALSSCNPPSLTLHTGTPAPADPPKREAAAAAAAAASPATKRPRQARPLPPRRDAPPRRAAAAGVGAAVAAALDDGRTAEREAAEAATAAVARAHARSAVKKVAKGGAVAVQPPPPVDVAADPEPAAAAPPDADDDSSTPVVDVLLGCTKCRYLKKGCASCRHRPVVVRDGELRWRPDSGRPQTAVPPAPTFHPTEAEFADPVAYINSIRAAGEAAGVACIVPPASWRPPFALERGTNGASAESFRFLIRRQLTSHLVKRRANTADTGNMGKYGKQRKKEAVEEEEEKRGGDEEDADDTSSSTAADSEDEADGLDDGEFGFRVVDRTHTLKSFQAYADWVKAIHFQPLPTGAAPPTEGAARRARAPPPSRPRQPTVEEIEAEFWRIVETPDATVASLYGQDLDSGHHGSGFPLPPLRRSLLAAHLAASAADRPQPKAASARASSRTAAVAPPSADGGAGGGQPTTLRDETPEEAAYARHPWNINNLPRCTGSLLRHLPGDDLITGVMVPWLYVGSALSAFCWHIEDHGLYSVNYMHAGAPKVWYSVPASGARALEAAFQDAVPHLTAAAPNLLFQLVTHMSPTELRARGVPVHRLVHHERSFVLTFPNAYHAGFNTGFNCAEAVNFGPPDWLAGGSTAVARYCGRKPPTFSHDALLVTLTRAARVHAPADAAAEAEAADEGGRLHDAARAAEAVAVATMPTDAGTPGHLRLSVVDPPKPEEVPLPGITAAAGELAVRIDEERRRRGAGAAAAGGSPGCCARMAGTAGAVAADGTPADGDDADCAVCKCDLWLSAVVAVPEGEGAEANPSPPSTTLVCPEHAAHLGVPPSHQRLLYRYTLAELEALVAFAEKWVDGVAAAVAAARERAAHPDLGPDPIPVGPLDQDTVLARKRAAEREAKAVARAVAAAKKEEEQRLAAEAAAAAAVEAPPALEVAAPVDVMAVDVDVAQLEEALQFV